MVVKRGIFFRFLTGFCLIALVGGCDTRPRDSGEHGSPTDSDSRYDRIVSLAPSITETLYALGLGENVVGVTRFCEYPPEAAEKPKVGGYLDPNYEMMVKLAPDIVFILPEHTAVETYLDRLGIRHETVHNRTVAEIMQTIETIGDLCGVAVRADSILMDINSRMDAIHEHVPAGSPPAVLVSIGRTMGSGTLKDVYIAGRGTFYDELIELAGGSNAYHSDNIAYPLLSAEGLMHLNPDIIIDLVPDFDKKGYDRNVIHDEWRTVDNVTAIQDSSVYLLTGDYTVIPGPRFILLLEDMAAVIQKDVNTQ